MIKYIYEQVSLFHYWVEVYDQYGYKLYKESFMSAPSLSLLKEILSDILFAKQINKGNKIFEYDIDPEERMDLMMISINKIEDGENDE